MTGASDVQGGAKTHLGKRHTSALNAHQPAAELSTCCLSLKVGSYEASAQWARCEVAMLKTKEELTPDAEWRQSDGSLREA